MISSVHTRTRTWNAQNQPKNSQTSKDAMVPTALISIRAVPRRRAVFAVRSRLVIGDPTPG